MLRDNDTVTRRTALKATGMASMAALAGCIGGDGGDGGDGGGSDDGGGGGGQTTQQSPADRLETFENEHGVPVGANWEAVQELAKEEEGDWTNMSSTDAEDVQIWMENFDWDFKENYQHVAGNSRQLAQRAIQEYRAGRPTMDFSVGNSAIIRLSQDDLAMELSADYLPQYGETDEVYKTPYILGARVKPYVVYYAPNEVDPDDVGSWMDLATDDQWTGNIGWDPTPNLGIAGALLRAEGREFFEAMVNQDVQWVDSHPDLARFVAAGRFPVSISYGKYLAEYSPDQLRVMDQLDFPASASGGGITSFATNPNQSLVFINYLSTPEGQEQMAKTHISIRHGLEDLPEAADWTYSEVVTDVQAEQDAAAVWEELGLGASA